MHRDMGALEDGADARGELVAAIVAQEHAGLCLAAHAVTLIEPQCRQKGPSGQREASRCSIAAFSSVNCGAVRLAEAMAFSPVPPNMRLPFC